MKKQILVIACLSTALVLFCLSLPCQAKQPWICPDDDPVNGVYWACNYFPLEPGNQWQYTTGEFHIENDIQKCDSGYSGILYATDTYKFSPYIQNGRDGLLFAGCQYDETVYEDFGFKIGIMPSKMKIGDTVSSKFKHEGVNSTFDVTLVGLETITVPAEIYDTIKIEIMIQDIGKCSYKTTLWLAKDIGPVKIHRTEANPADCGGCIFVCNPDHDLIKLNTAAELVSYHVTNTPDYYTLTVESTGTGSGTIKGKDISCNGNTCEGIGAPGTAISLTAKANPGSTFVGWNGGNCSGTGKCNVVLNDDITVTAEFKLQEGTPKISVSPMSVNLGTAAIGNESDGRPITIKNTGKGALIIESISITGANSGEFILDDQCLTVPAGSSCTMSVSFLPSPPHGKKNAILSITSNDPKKPVINVKLSGQTPPGKIKVAP
jgi:hypothetical protein